MEDIKQRVEKVIEKFNLDEKRKQVREIEAESTNPDFWKDHQNASAKMKELSKLQKEITDVEKLNELLSSVNLAEAEKLLDELETLLYFTGDYDSGSAIIELHSGQGGVEAMDWTNMLYRMYTRFFDKKGWVHEVIEEIPGEEAGLKSITVQVVGDYAYGFLKHEAGVHRLVRQSPFRSNAGN